MKQMNIYDIAEIAGTYNYCEFIVKLGNGHKWKYEFPLDTLLDGKDYHIVRYPINAPDRATDIYLNYEDTFNVISIKKGDTEIEC